MLRIIASIPVLITAAYALPHKDYIMATQLLLVHSLFLNCVIFREDLIRKNNGEK